SLDLFVVLSDRSIPREEMAGLSPGNKNATALVLRPLSIPAVLGVGWRYLCRVKACPALLLVGWRLCAISGHLRDIDRADSSTTPNLRERHRPLAAHCQRTGHEASRVGCRH